MDENFEIPKLPPHTGANRMGDKPKKVVIVGATTGMGTNLARMLAEKGTHVVVEQDAVNTVAFEIPHNINIIKCPLKVEPFHLQRKTKRKGKNRKRW